MTTTGTALLAAVLGAALAGSVLWARLGTRGATAVLDASGTSRLGRWAGAATTLAFGAAVAAVALLETALLRGDTSVQYAAKVVDPGMSGYYRFTALWSAMEGSLLLWLLCTVTVAAVWVRLSTRTAAVRAAFTAAVLTGLVAAFAAVVLVANPFLPTDGSELVRPSPLLQDHPAMGLHPPLLYAGFTALAVPYALSVAALLEPESDTRWVRTVHAWTVAAWVPLTAGVVLGAWWSYAVLGWGGYWAWDPVENASLMPWLLATALLHTVSPGTRSRAGHGWAVVLAGAGYLFVLLAVFLTRSGVVESIHAFSTSPLGPVLLGITLAAAVPWATLLFTRRHRLRTSETAPVLSLHSVLQAHRVLMVLITLVVLVGSVLPAVVLAATGERLSVGPPWYARTLGPPAVALLVLMAMAPSLSWRGDSLPELLGRLRIPAVGAAAVSGAVGLAVPDAWLAVAAGLAAFVLVDLLRRALRRRGRSRRTTGALMAHVGVALGAVAVVAGAHGTAVERTVPVGGTVVAGATTVTLLELERHRAEGTGPAVARARLLLGHDGEPLGTAEPELRWYAEHGTVLTGPAIQTEFLRDVYVTLLDVDPGTKTATLRLAINPLTGWLWASGTFVVAGAVLSAWPSRHRKARRDKAPRPGAQSPADRQEAWR